jgi:sugar PTS system EIIA component
VTLRVSSPVDGSVVALSAVPDPVFAQAIVGPGVAVAPALVAADAFSPVDGVVMALHPHAFAVASASGQAVLVHLGIDTVKLKGEGFVVHVVKGETVRAGQPIVGWNPAAIMAAGFSPICPIVALDASEAALTDIAPDGPVVAGDHLFSWNA